MHNTRVSIGGDYPPNHTTPSPPLCGVPLRQALTQAMVHSENLRKLTANLHTLCVVSHRLKDRRVATQVVLEVCLPPPPPQASPRSRA